MISVGYPIGTLTEGAIPTDDPAVQRILQLIPVKYREHAWIGGSAACLWPYAQQRGGDVDCWLAHPGSWNEYDEMYGEMIKQVPEDARPQPSDYDSTGFDMFYSKDGVQIMGSNQSMQQIVDSFDISCHASAVNLVSRERVSHPEYNPYVVRLLRITGNRISFARVCKFAIRYNDRSFWLDPSSQRAASLAFCDPGLAVGEGM